MSERDDNPFIRSSPWGRAKGAAPFGYALRPQDQPAAEPPTSRPAEPPLAPRPAVQGPTPRPSVSPQAGILAGGSLVPRGPAQPTPTPNPAERPIQGVRPAFLGATDAEVRAQLAELLGERTVTGDRVAAEPADRGALDTAGGTGVGAGLAGHVRETVATFGRAVITRGDAVLGSLVQMLTHGMSPSL